MPLKWKSAARGMRAPRLLSIFGWFFPLPSQEYGADSVALPACPLVLAAARAPPAARYGDAQSDNRLATIPSGREVWSLLEGGPGAAR
jgi:hypothetical protein